MTPKKFSGVKKKLSVQLLSQRSTADVVSHIAKALADETLALSDTEIEDQIRGQGADPDLAAERMRTSLSALLGTSSKD